MAYRYDGRGFEQEPPHKDDNDVGSWILIGALFLFGLWPIGLVVLLNKLSDKTVKNKKTEAKTENRTATWTETAPKTEGRTSAAQKVTATAKKVTRTPQYGEKGAKIMKIVGIVTAVIGVIGMLSTMGELGFYMEHQQWIWDFAQEIFFATGIAAGGVSLIFGSRAMTLRSRRFAKYLAAAGTRSAVPLEELADAANVKVSRVEKDLELMVSKGLWGSGAYVDSRNAMLFRSHADRVEFYEAQRRAMQLEREAKAKQQKTAYAVQAQGYDAMIANIRRANDRIEDDVLSEKIDRLEHITRCIFKVIENEPAKKEKANTFLNYYLPTTQKLLDSYADFEEAGISGENLNQAKARIEKTMDNIVAGFEHQLDELYRTAAMDVDSEIRVMETMLRRDSASAEKDFGLDGGTAVASEETE